MTSDLMLQPAVQLYMFCAAILTLKMIVTGSGTGAMRVVKGVFISSEDYAFAGKVPAASDESIERIRRAHQNDLENVLPFLVVGFLYALTGPSYDVVWWLYSTFTSARILHTICYVLGLQPWRTLIFEVANVALIAITVLLLGKVI